MYKIEQVKTLFNCDQCNKLLVDPITIPCGNTICKKHLDSLLENIKNGEISFKCHLCNDMHVVQSKGFVVNKRIQNALDIKFNTLTLNPIYNDCKNTIDKTREIAAEIEPICNDPESYFFEYFEDIKRQVDLRREALKLKIDEYSDEVIKSADEYKSECIKISKTVSELNKDIHELKNKLDKLVERFDTFDIDEKKFSDVKKETIIVRDQLYKYKEQLFSNKAYSFVFNDQPIGDIFGKIDSKMVFFFIFIV